MAIVDRPISSAAAAAKTVRAILTVCVIARNNERTIRACIESIRPWVDRIVVVDTGSTDRTPEICRELGAEVYFFPWIDDFSAARNESLKYATGDWILWIDTDDTIDAANGRRLRDWVDTPHPPNVLAFVMQVHCPKPTEDGIEEVTVVDHVKLFRNLPQLRFEGRIHEQILSAVRRLGGEIGWTDIFVVHSGADHTPEGKACKLERDLRILHLDNQERPNHTFVNFNLGMTYADVGQHREASRYLRRSLELAQPGDTHLRKVYALLIGSLTALQEFAEAEQVCSAGRKLFPKDVELLFRQAILAQAQGQLATAADRFREVLRVRDDLHFSSVVTGLQGYTTRCHLALVLSEMGRPDLAEVQWRAIIAERPHFRPAWRGLAHDLLARGRLTTLEILIERAERVSSLAVEALVLRGRLAWARGDLIAARQLFENAGSQEPQNSAVWDALSHFHFLQGQLDAAETAFRHLIELQPKNGAAWNNLGVIFINQGRPVEAREAFQKSLEFRPNQVSTIRNLAAVEQTLASAASSGMSPEVPLSTNVELPVANGLAADLPACHSRREFDAVAGRFYCAHPRVGTPGGMVSPEFCRQCALAEQAAPATFRELPPPLLIRRVMTNCRHLGEVLGQRECVSCRGKVQVKVFACRHLAHGETTWNECQECPDRVPTAELI